MHFDKKILFSQVDNELNRLIDFEKLFVYIEVKYSMLKFEAKLLNCNLTRHCVCNCRLGSFTVEDHLRYSTLLDRRYRENIIAAKSCYVVY